MSEPENRPESCESLVRTEHGQFPKGKSGNPGGRPKLPPEVVEMLRLRTLEMFEGLYEIARNGKRAMNVNGAVVYVDDDALRAHVMQVLIERAVGKPTQVFSLEDENGNPTPAAIGIVFLPTGAKP